jgi:hypothetical protein
MLGRGGSVKQAALFVIAPTIIIPIKISAFFAGRSAHRDSRLE